MADFPLALAGILDKENVNYYDGVYQRACGTNYVRPATEDILLKIHSKDMIESIKMTADFEGASYSAGVTVQAAEEIHKGNLDNAFAFTGFGDHHAGRNYFGGMCYFNGAALAIAKLRENKLGRFAIVDTDSHHGDGTRDIFYQDKDVLHICFCHQHYCDGHNNVDIAIPYGISDEDYLQKARIEFVSRIQAFRPELIFWEFGYDATKGEYGGKGLTRDCHLELARIIKSTADEFCHGKLVTVLCGGSRRDLAAYIIPRIISILAELD